MLTLNTHPVVVTQFPDKTSQVWKLPDAAFLPESEIVWRFESEAELAHLLQLQALLQSKSCAASLTMPYLPYGRQDKPINNQETFALRPFLKVLAQLDFKTIRVFDPHNSAVVREHLSNFVEISPAAAITNAIEEIRPDLLCFPDAGALSRYSEVLEYPSIHAQKRRNQSTGEIVTLDIAGDFSGQTVLVVDDICDGGMTFIRLAGALAGANSVHLYVSHGLFTKGTQVLRDAGIERIFTQEGEIK
jgi:ribose-phosphate pyrophosphokinase